MTSSLSNLLAEMLLSHKFSSIYIIYVSLQRSWTVACMWIRTTSCATWTPYTGRTSWGTLALSFWWCRPTTAAIHVSTFWASTPRICMEPQLVRYDWFSDSWAQNVKLLRVKKNGAGSICSCNNAISLWDNVLNGSSCTETGSTNLAISC